MSYNIVSSKVTGIGHIASGMPCQDSYSSFQSDGLVVIALADGAGSARFSEIGSEIAVNTLIEIMKEDFDSFLVENQDYILSKKILSRIEKELKKKAISSTFLCSQNDNIKELINDKIEENVQEGVEIEDGGVDMTSSADMNLEVKLHDFASTLLFVAIKGDKYVVGHLGDGIVGVFKVQKNGEKTIEVLSYPENGEYANETFFTTSREAEKYLRISSSTVDTEEGFILMSDGAGESFYQNKTKELIPLVKQIMEDIRDIKNLDEVQKNVDALMENRVKHRTSDDCSIVCAVKKYWFDES